MGVWLLAAVVYHVVAIADFPTDPGHTHVETTGRVTLLKKEADGDWHLRLDDGAGHFVVAEIVPNFPVRRPRVGQCVTVRGLRRFDDESPGHHWWEVHPVWQLTVVPCGRKLPP